MHLSRLDRDHSVRTSANEIGPFNECRQSVAVGGDPRAHCAEWIGDAAHGPSHQRCLAMPLEAPGLRGKQPHCEARGRATVAAVKLEFACSDTTICSSDRHVRARIADVASNRAHYIERTPAVLGGRCVDDGGNAAVECGEEY